LWYHQQSSPKIAIYNCNIFKVQATGVCIGKTSLGLHRIFPKGVMSFMTFKLGLCSYVSPI
jgi:hypothetical protein